MVGSSTYTERYVPLYFLIFSVCACGKAECFSAPSAPIALPLSSPRSESRVVQIPRSPITRTTLRALGDLFEDITAPEESLQQATLPTQETEAESKSALTDSNDNVFTVGCTVRVCKPDLHMHQVGSKATGLFDESGIFVADPSLRYLALPIGLQGTVTKIYKNSENKLSANFPIRVEFRPAVKGDGESSKMQEARNLDPPSRFTAHFATNEVDCVV